MNILSNAQKSILRKETKRAKKESKSFKFKKGTVPKKGKTFTGSNGERLIASYLKKKKLNFIREKPIPDISKHK